jgi:hypothetical protein
LRRWGGAAGGDMVLWGGGVGGTGEFGRRPKMVPVTEEPMAQHPRRTRHMPGSPTGAAAMPRRRRHASSPYTAKPRRMGSRRA